MTNILIIKQGALGDVLRSTCILTGIKRKYPNSKITWFTKLEALDLVKTNPYINKIVLYGKENILNLKQETFDIVINLDEDYEACSLTSHFLNKKAKIYGYYVNNENKIVPTKSAEYYFKMSLIGPKPMNDVLKKKNKKTYPELIYDLSELTYKKDPPILILTKKQKEFAKDFLRRYNLKKDDFIVGINTGAGVRWPLKSLPIDKTIELIQKLYKELNAKIILLGGPDQIERNNKILTEARVPLINAGCGNYIFELASLISICDTVVTSDSLGLHISLALKRNTITFFGQTAPQEIEMYTQGLKIFTPSDCVGCYSSYDGRIPSCIDGVYVKDLLNAAIEVKKQSLSIILMSNKLEDTEKSLRAIVDQKIPVQYEIIISSKDKNTKDLAKKYPNLKIVLQKENSNLINSGLELAKNKIILVTNDLAILSNSSINEVLNSFKDPSVGCVTGRPISLNPKNNLVGYWSHLLLDAGAHKIRKELSQQEKFFEGTNYLFAFKNGFVKEIPLGVAEDHLIPYIFWRNFYKLKYIENAKVLVKNPVTLNEWFEQKSLHAKKHEVIQNKLKIKEAKVKSLKNEILKGTISALTYPRTIKEFYWTILLFFARLSMWLNVIIKK
ncbi:MAG: glycosyltransferase family 9 protein [Nanoarchaeota archaeon]